MSRGRVRIRLAARSRGRMTVVIRGRTGKGTHFTRRHTYRGCGS
jgi:hypothetical protein